MSLPSAYYPAAIIPAPGELNTSADNGKGYATIAASDLTIPGAWGNQIAVDLRAVQAALGTAIAGTLSDLKTRLAVSINNDGTIKALTAKGDLLIMGAAPVRLPVGADGQVLVADATQALGVRWSNWASPLSHAATHIPGAYDSVFPNNGLGFLYNDGVGNTSWRTSTATPGGSTKQVQINNAGSFSGSNNFVFDPATGRVGIGLGGADPNYDLEVNGDIFCGGSMVFNAAVGVRTGSPRGVFEAFGDAASGANVDNVVLGGGAALDYGQSLVWKPGTGADATWRLAEIVAVRESAGYLGGMSFRVNSADTLTGTTAALYLSSAGKVGVRTSSPRAYFETYGDSATGANIDNIALAGACDPGYGQSIVWKPGSGGDVTWRLAEIVAIRSGAGYLGGLSFRVNTADTLTGTTEALRIDDNGNVGIGTTDPTAALTVKRTAANSYVDIDSTTLEAGLHLNTNGANRWSFYKNTVVGGEDLYVYNYGTSAVAMAIMYANSNVGIGVISATSRLHVANTTSWDSTNPLATLSNVETGATYGNGLLLQGGADSASSYELCCKDLSGNVDFYVRGDGQVGIGTASPAETLDIAGKLRVVGVQWSPGSSATSTNSISTGITFSYDGKVYEIVCPIPGSGAVGDFVNTTQAAFAVQRKA
jgi:hypothetical protein